jgi:hypothetical protein
MSSTISTKPSGGGPHQPGGSLYETDLYAWSLEQARLLKERRFDEIDVENVADEILDVAKTEYRAFAAELGFTSLVAVPVSALRGDNIVQRSERMPCSRPTLPSTSAEALSSSSLRTSSVTSGSEDDGAASVQARRRPEGHTV